MVKQKSIVILICYFGKLPWYFDYFLYSRKYNPNVHFKIITDNDVVKNSFPRNALGISNPEQH